MDDLFKSKPRQDEIKRAVAEFFVSYKGIEVSDWWSRTDTEVFNFVMTRMNAYRIFRRIMDPVFRKATMILRGEYVICTKDYGELRFPRAKVKYLNDRMHCADGPAISFPSRDYFFWKGYHVDREIVMDPIRFEQIEKCRNAELRRILIERYGFDNYLRDGDFKIKQRDDFGILYRKEFHEREDDGRRNWHPPIQLVKVINATKEPDGTYKEYVIPVLNTVRSAHEAVASSFGLTVETYNPFRQS